MTIPDSNIERQVLVGEYVLGLLEGAEHDDVRAWVQSDRQGAAIALQWEDHFLALTDRLVPASVPQVLWDRIQSAIRVVPSVASGATAAGTSAAPSAPVGPAQGVSAQDVASTGPSASSHGATRAGRSARGPGVAGRWQQLWESASTWRWLSAGFAAATIALAVVPSWRAPEPNTPRIAVLQQPGQAAAPGWVVSVLDGGDVQIKGLAPLPTPPGKSVQIWTLAPGEKKPRSMGLLADRQTVRLDGELVGAVQPGQLFEFTLEQEGGSPTGLPTGPVLFIGRIVAATL